MKIWPDTRSPGTRDGWTRFAVPLAGDADWERVTEGSIDLGFIQSLSFQFDSWGGEPFTIVLDGVRFE